MDDDSDTFYRSEYTLKIVVISVSLSEKMLFTTTILADIFLLCRSGTKQMFIVRLCLAWKIIIAENTPFSVNKHFTHGIKKQVTLFTEMML